MRASWIALLLLVPLVLRAQSPWTRSKAGAYAQFSWNGIPRYGSVYDDQGKEKALSRDITENCLQLYGEYGLGKHCTLIGSVPYRFLHSGDPNASTQPFQDKGKLGGRGNISLALRQSLFPGRVQVSGTLRVDLPSGGYGEKTGLRSGYPALTVLPMLNAGMGFQKAYGFVYGGYGLRTKQYSPFIQTGVEAGYHFVNKLWLIAYSEYVGPLQTGTPDLPEENLQTYLFVNKQGWLSIGIKSILEINRFIGFNAYFSGAAWARNVPYQASIGTGVYFKWD